MARLESRSRDGDTYQWFARILLQVDFVTACEALRGLVGRWRKASNELWELLGLISPFWVEEEEATPIAERELLKDRSKRLLALDVENPWAARAFICRACLWSLDEKRIYEIEPPDDEDDFGSLKRHILDHLGHARSRISGSGG